MTIIYLLYVITVSQAACDANDCASAGHQKTILYQYTERSDCKAAINLLLKDKKGKTSKFLKRFYGCEPILLPHESSLYYSTKEFGEVIS
jgi:hypothetical protein